MSARRGLVAALLAATLISGCGDDSDEPTPAQAPQVETADSVPDLRRGWEVHANRAGGFAFGLPPGWKARDRGTTTEVRSFDGLVVLSIAADRTTEAIEISPAAAAPRTLSALESYREPIEPGQPRKLDHRYEAYEASGEGRSTDNLEQDVTVVVLRRDDSAVITVLIAANADERAKPARRIADQVVESLRTQPPNAAVR